MIYNLNVGISLIVTTRNEADALPRLLNSIAAQTHIPDEIVIVDGGSTDDTLRVLHAYASKLGLPLKIMSQPGANISQGRNIAIRSAANDVICSTDAGVRLDRDWVQELVQPFLSADSCPDVVSGFFLPDPRGVFETALAATTLPALADIQPDRFLPSSRSIAFRKSAWEKVHGYPEWLDYCEDLVFDLSLRAAGSRFTVSPRAVVYFRPRENLAGFFKQYYRYARGDGKANLWLKRHVIRYLTYLVALPVAIALIVVSPFLAILLWLVAIVGMFYTPYKRLLPMLKALSPIDRLRAAAWVPVIRIAGDVAKMIGYPVGVWWRMWSRAGVDTRATLP